MFLRSKQTDYSLVSIKFQIGWSFWFFKFQHFVVNMRSMNIRELVLGFTYVTFLDRSTICYITGIFCSVRHLKYVISYYSWFQNGIYMCMFMYICVCVCVCVCVCMCVYVFLCMYVCACIILESDNKVIQTFKHLSYKNG